MQKRENRIVIRPMRPEDAGTWEKLRSGLWPDGAPDHAEEIRKFFEGTLAEPDAAFIAEDESANAIAILELSIRDDIPGIERKRTGYVEGLYVIPERRHQGIARQLLETARAWAKENRCQAFASDRAGRIVIDRTFP